jgi:hypothetical protein
MPTNSAPTGDINSPAEESGCEPDSVQTRPAAAFLDKYPLPICLLPLIKSKSCSTGVWAKNKAKNALSLKRSTHQHGG